MKKNDKEYVVFTDDIGIFKQAKKMDYDDITLYTSTGQLKQTNKCIAFLYYFNDFDEEDEKIAQKHEEMVKANKNIYFINLFDYEHSYEETLKSMMTQKKIEGILIHRGRIHEKNIKNRCGNCHAILEDGSEYCYVCGTKRGEGKFEPFFNEMCLVYGPPVTQIVTCENCGYKFTIGSLGGKTIKYCPKCGKDLLNIEEKVFWYDDEDDNDLEDDEFIE